MINPEVTYTCSDTGRKVTLPLEFFKFKHHTSFVSKGYTTAIIRCHDCTKEHTFDIKDR